MKHAATMQSSFAMLFDPELVRAVAERAARLNLPRHLCRPLDKYVGPATNADLAAYDADVELAPEQTEETLEKPPQSNIAADVDAEDDDL